MTGDPLFSQAKIGNLAVKNRFVRSATWEGMADENGHVTEELINMYDNLAQGGVGLIITGHAYIREEGKATPRQLGIYRDDLISGLRGLAETVHRLGAKIIIQLSHSGRFGKKSISGNDPINPSLISKEEIDALIRAFACSAVRAKDAGFDGVQLHAAHGYLISQFFSPIFNKRDDEYGGSIRNRARFAEEILKSIKKELGSDYPVLIKMNCSDFQDGGLQLKDSIEIARILVDNGIDAIEISGGLLYSKDKGPCRTYEGPYFLKEAVELKKELDVPMILVGGIRSYETSKRVWDAGIDLISMSRPLICESGLIKRWQMGDRRRSLCRSDNRCLGAVKGTVGVRCFRRGKDGV